MVSGLTTVAIFSNVVLAQLYANLGYTMLTPSIGFWATPLTITGAWTPAASRMVGTMSIMVPGDGAGHYALRQMRPCGRTRPKRLEHRRRLPGNWGRYVHRKYSRPTTGRNRLTKIACRPSCSTRCIRPWPSVLNCGHLLIFRFPHKPLPYHPPLSFLRGVG
jgi:hypothetical protein